jgi:hypothetical protein
MHDFTVQWWPTDKPIPYIRNARNVSERAIDKVNRFRPACEFLAERKAAQQRVNS